jgi:hypothetical protein
MRLLDAILGIRRPAAAVPADMTAALEPMFTDGSGDGAGVGLTGFPHFIGAETDGGGIRYVRLRIGFGPDAHVIVRTGSARYCAEAADSWVRAYEALEPLPSEMGDVA